MAIAAEGQNAQYETIADPDTRFIARDLHALGGVWNSAKREWVFPGSELERRIAGPNGEQKVKVYSDPVSDKADALLELYHATRPTPEEMKQLEETVKRVPLVALGIFENAKSPEAKQKIADLLNPHIVTRSRVQALLTKTAGFFMDATPEQHTTIKRLIETGYDKVAWDFDPVKEPHKLFGPDAKEGHDGKLTVARASQLIDLAKPYVLADQRKAKYRADMAELKEVRGEMDGRSRGVDYTKMDISDDAASLNFQQRLGAEGGVDERRRSAFDAKRAHDQRSREAEEHGKRPDRLDPESLGFAPDRAGLAEERRDADPLTAARENLQRKLGEILEAESSYSATDVVLREPRVGTTLSGTVIAFEKIEDGFLAAIQHETSPKTFTLVPTQTVRGGLADGAFVKLAFDGEPSYQIVVENGFLGDGIWYEHEGRVANLAAYHAELEMTGFNESGEFDNGTVKIVDTRDPKILERIANSTLRQASGLMTLAEAQAFGNERGYQIFSAPDKDTSPFKTANVLFSGIGNKIKHELNSVPSEVAMKAWGFMPSKDPGFFKKTSAEQGRVMLEQATGYNPALESAAMMHALMQERAIKNGAQGASEIPIDRSSAGTFTAEIFYNDGTHIGLDRGFNRWSQARVDEVSTRLGNMKAGDRVKVEIKANSDKLHVSKAGKPETSTGGHKRTMRVG